MRARRVCKAGEKEPPKLRRTRQPVLDRDPHTLRAHIPSRSSSPAPRAPSCPSIHHQQDAVVVGRVEGRCSYATMLFECLHASICGRFVRILRRINVAKVRASRAGSPSRHGFLDRSSHRTQIHLCRGSEWKALQPSVSGAVFCLYLLFMLWSHYDQLSRAIQRVLYLPLKAVTMIMSHVEPIQQSSNS